MLACVLFLSLLFRLLFPPVVLFWWAPNLLFPFSGFWVSLFVLSFFLVGVFRPLPCYWRQSYKIEGEMFLNPVGWSWGNRPPPSPRAQEEVFQLPTFYPVLSQHQEQKSFSPLRSSFLTSVGPWKHTLMVQCQNYPWIFTNLCQLKSSQGLLWFCPCTGLSDDSLGSSLTHGKPSFLSPSCL